MDDFKDVGLPWELALEAERQGEALRQAAGLGGPASGEELAEALGVEVEVCALPPGVAGTCDPWGRRVLVARSLRAARRAYTICHELAELHLPARLAPHHHEPFCQRSAAALLMPRGAFLASLGEVGLDALELRRRWRHCSVEALATRAAELCVGVGASAWIRERLRWRRGASGQVGRPNLAALERQALRLAYLQPRGVAEVAGPGLLVRAWRTSALPNRAVVLNQHVRSPPDVHRLSR